MMDEAVRGWAIGIGVGFPLLLLVLNELIVRSRRRGGVLTSTLISLRNLLLPALGVALLVRYVLAFPAGGTADQVAETLLWTIVLYVALSFVNDVVFGAAAAGTWRANVPDLLRDVVRSVLVGVGAAFIYSQIWGKELAGALTALGVGSLVIGLALQEPLGNVFSGIMLLFERPVAIGDWVTVDNHTGRVVTMNWRAVNIETRTHEVIVVPNSSLYKTSFANLSRPTPVRTESVEFGFSYDDAPVRVKQLLLELLRETPGVLTEPAPQVHTVRYADYSIIYQARFSVHAMEQLQEVRDRVMTRLWYMAQRAGLTIPYPIAIEVGDTAGEFARRRAVDSQTLVHNHPQFRTAPEAGQRLLRFSPGEFLLKQGDEQDGLGLLVDGEAVWTAPDQTGAECEIGRATAGSFYGEHSLLAGEASQAALRAVTEVQVVFFPLTAARQLTESSPSLARQIGETIDQRHRAVRAVRQRKPADEAPASQEAMRQSS